MKSITIEEAPGYILYEDGRLFSIRTQKFLSQIKNTNGYYIYCLTVKKNVRKKFYVHRLLAKYFIENDDPINKTQVNHKDENRLNNNLDNLEWISMVDNLQYGTAQERSAKTRQRKVDLLDKMNGIPIKTFDSVKEAAAFVNRSPATLLPALKHFEKSCGGKYWRYHTD